ncbi:hypothetical protein Nepgr_005280 [Nepenthes gracilis]|uniref:Uncharacterized protein n=1 Tax=Nepenthes gracilis TaxID=150966 RepID=A0AAD3S3C7_NEPGR|nr:hypothetical protein Nepgr_005280 [Nepenthes gracilis]
MGFESVLPSPLRGIGGAGVSMVGHGAVSSGGSPPPPSMTTIPSETGNPSLISLSDVDSADFRVEPFPSLPADNIHKDRVCPPPVLNYYPHRSVDGGWIQAPSLKVVRFAPEILSAEAPSCAPHHRMLAPCNDICHPIKFRRSNLGNLASDGVPMDGSPKLAAPPFAPPRETLAVVPLDDALSSIDIRPILEAARTMTPSIPPSME